MELFQDLDAFLGFLGSLPLPANIYAFVFYAALLYAVLMTLALVYHWIRFSPGIIRTSLVMLIYLVGVGFLLLAAFSLMIAFL